MTVHRDIAEGLAVLLNTASLGTFHADPTTPYVASDIAITHKVLPQSPDRAIAISVVPLTDDPSMPLGTVMVQLRGRGKAEQPLDVDDVLDPIFDLLHGRTDLVLGSTTVIQILRTTSISNGQDDSKRFERIDQFYLDVDYAPTNLRPFGGSW